MAVLKVRAWQKAGRHNVLLLVALAICTICATTMSGLSRAQAVSESEVKAALVLNFARYVDWPDTAFKTPTDDVVVCLIGRDPVAGALSALEGKSVRNRRVKVRAGVTADTAESCHVAYISDSEERRILPLLMRLADKPILTVSDIAAFAEAGGAVGIVTGESRLQFDINRHALEQVGLKASSNLLKLARKLVSSCISLRDTENRLAPPVQGANASHSPAMASICNAAMADAKRFECSKTSATRH